MDAMVEKAISDKEWLHIVEDLLESPVVKSMSMFKQHRNTNCLYHCIHVSYSSYLFCKERKLNYIDVARGALLHDLFLYDWHIEHGIKRRRLHGVFHAKVACENACKYFRLTESEKNIILRHMFPLNPIPPKYIIGFVVMFYDKYWCIKEARGKI